MQDGRRIELVDLSEDLAGVRVFDEYVGVGVVSQ
jgi:hypothetical protein